MIDLLAIDLVAGLGRGHQICQKVRSAQKQRNQVGLRLKPSRPHFVQRGFELVCETNQVVESESARAAFDRMNSPEDRVHLLRIAIAVPNGGEACFKILKQIFALKEERLPDFVHRVHWQVRFGWFRQLHDE